MKKRRKRRKDALPPGPKQPAALTSLRKGVTLAKIHAKTGISVSHLSYVFSGQSNPSIPAAKKIAAYLHVSLDKLCGALPTGK